MKKEMLSKILVIGVILLFIGVGIQPAFAVKLKLSTDKTDKVEDCEKIDEPNPFIVKLWLNKVEVLTNIIISRFGHIPEIEENCNNIFNNINSYDSLSNGQVICAILIGIYSVISSILHSIEELQEKLIEKYPIIGVFMAAFIDVLIIPIVAIHYFLETFISIFCS